MSSSFCQFFYKHCRNGHMTYAEGALVTQARCAQCGEEYVERCDGCDYVVPNTFASMVYFTDRRPMRWPTRPDFCTACGKAMPWTESQHQRIEAAGVWGLMHPRVVELARSRFTSGHYADAVEATFKELNAAVKVLHLEATGDELDGVALMRRAFGTATPPIRLDDLNTETGKNIQQGYMDLFAGSMSGIRNPKAHGNIVITPERAIHHLMLASLLFCKLDERRKP